MSRAIDQPPAPVSVVIPTTGRSEVRNAVASALHQTTLPSEVIVVPNSPGAHKRTVTSLAGINAESVSVRVLDELPYSGGGIARNVGTNEAAQPLIAYLDDDDIWYARKLMVQLGALSVRQRLGGRVLATAKVDFVRPGRLETASVYPRERVPPPSRLAPWLVQRRSVRFGSSMVQSSALLVDARTARETGWDPDLRKHQDWDFVIRAATKAGGVSETGDEPLLRVHQGSAGSVSKAADWRASCAFLRKHDAIVGRARADFTLVHICAAALESGGVRELSAALRVVPLRAVPHHGAAAVLGRAAIRHSSRVLVPRYRRSAVR